MKWLRGSFGAKLLAALLGTVGILLLVMFAVVRGETALQVDEVVERTVSGAEQLFGELTALQQEQVAQFVRPFTEGRRQLALLDATIQDQDFDFLAEEVVYRIQLAGIPDALLGDLLLSFTDASARPILTLHGLGNVTEGDPADLVPLARRLLESGRVEMTAYRMVAGRMYSLTSQYLELVQPIGTVTFGLPVDSAAVDEIGTIGGFEACFWAEDRCVVQTAGVDTELERLITRAAERGETVRSRAGGNEYTVRTQPLTADDPSQGQRVIAIPLDEVQAPFDRIERALLAGGGGALLLSALLGVALSRSLTRPMRALVAATGRVAEGDFDAEVAATSDDEMGTLAHAFNDMTRGLRAREQYRSVLNKVVSHDVFEELMRGDVELGGESREVSVLFADIRGFTPLTEGMAPQEVIALLNGCMEYLSRAIDAERGVVDKYIGDEVMAVFGAPVVMEDHARRAVSAAVRMREGIAAFNADRERRGEPPIAIGVGINSGVAVAGNMGSTNRMNYTVVGDMVNLASRLAGLAGPGEILVSGSTLERVGSGITAPPLGGRALKGFSAEVEVYAVQSIADVGPRARSGPRDPSGAPA